MMKFKDELLFKFFAKENTPEEADAISAWLREDASHKQQFEQAYKLFVLTALASKGMSSKNAQARIARKEKMHRIVNWTLAGVAGAAVAASIAIGFVSRTRMNDVRKMENVTLVSETKPGKQIRQTLSDGTVVEINSASRLEYPAIFTGNERRVRLDGEAVFEVSHDQQHPFIVETFAYDVRVLGTKFDVIANESGKEFSTTLIEGKVAIENKENLDTEVTLNPNQRVWLAEDGLHKETLHDVLSDVLWTNDQLSIGGVPFEELMRKVERCYGVKVSIDRPTPPVNGYVHMKVHISEGFDHLMRQLQKKSDFTYYFDDDDGIYHIE